jgi:peptidoglycan/LPS O-acetylase OafA/YrhL
MKQKLNSIQILRAVAAIAVVGAHSLNRAVRAFPLQAPHSLLANFHDFYRLGEAGVDVFFVISGFVMMYVHYDDFAVSNAPRRFIGRRLLRVVPLYWTLSALAVVLLAVAPRYFSIHSELDAPWIVGSFLFILIAPHSGAASPVIGQGWTLDFEMFFYAIFSGALLLPRRMAIPAISACFAVLIAIGQEFPVRPSWLVPWTDPLLTEFLAGVALAIAYRLALPIFSTRVGYCVLVLGIAMFAITIWGAPPAGGWLRPLKWGFPAVLVVWGALSLKFHNGPAVAIGRLLGDASYSIYLFQAFALPALAVALKALLRGRALPVDLSAGILLCAAVMASVGCWYIVERPMTRYLGAVLQRRESSKTI